MANGLEQSPHVSAAVGAAFAAAEAAAEAEEEEEEEEEEEWEGTASSTLGEVPSCLPLPSPLVGKSSVLSSVAGEVALVFTVCFLLELAFLNCGQSTPPLQFSLQSGWAHFLAKPLPPKFAQVSHLNSSALPLTVTIFVARCCLQPTHIVSLGIVDVGIQGSRSKRAAWGLGEPRIGESRVRDGTVSFC